MSEFQGPLRGTLQGPKSREFPLSILLLLFLAFVMPAGAQTRGVQSPGRAATWGEGPVRWLMLASEQREYRRLRSGGEIAQFIEEFWRRRDPAPEVAGNPHLDRFLLRVQEADMLFGAGDLRGSLTARGRAHILLGPPSVLSQQYRASPSLESGRDRGRDVGVDHILIESWSYRPEDLTAELRLQLDDRGWSLELEVRFQIASEQDQILAGEELLQLAARALLRDP